MCKLLKWITTGQVPFVGTGEDERPWYRVISEKAHKEKLWEVTIISLVVFIKNMTHPGDDPSYGGVHQGGGVAWAAHQVEMTFVVNLLLYNPMHFVFHSIFFTRGHILFSVPELSVLDSKDVLGRPPKTNSHSRPEGLQNVQESAYKYYCMCAFHFKLCHLGRPWGPQRIGQSAAISSALKPALFEQGLDWIQSIVWACVRFAFHSGLTRVARSRTWGSWQKCLRTVSWSTHWQVATLSLNLFSFRSRARGVGGSALWPKDLQDRPGRYRLSKVCNVFATEYQCQRSTRQIHQIR